ncbi:MAG: SCE4755 family polysaccharide monooxygenase-like protein [Polyangiales bacterium]
MTPLLATTRRVALAACALFATIAPAERAAAHFLLLSPDSSHAQNFLGDPQKQPPCGDVAGTMASGKVTAFDPGETISIRINETIYHPGHYRVALAKTRAELPPEPKVTRGSTDCGSAEIDRNPSFPVLVDGALEHDAPFSGEQTIEVTLPTDLTCDNCVLQVIEFMSEHGLNNPGGCYYHHCAQISLKAAPGADAGTKADAGTGTKADAGAKTDAGTSTKTDGGTKVDAGAGDDDEHAEHADHDDDAVSADDDDAPKPQTDMTSGCDASGGGNGTLWLYGVALMVGLIARGRSRARR